MKAEVRAVAELAESDVDRMFHLYTSYFDGTSASLFRSDLAGKDYIILLRDSVREIRGFSTGQVLEAPGVRAIFSGDTIIHHECWGEQALPLAFATHAGTVKEQHPDQPLYWFLITKGYRTYRYLPLFFYEYFPRWDAATPPDAQRVIDLLACTKFGTAYDRQRGIVAFSESHGHLKSEWAGIPEAALRKPEVRYFLERNPGFAAGEELVCLTELSAANIRPLARRAFLQASAA